MLLAEIGWKTGVSDFHKALHFPCDAPDSFNGNLGELANLQQEGSFFFVTKKGKKYSRQLFAMGRMWSRDRKSVV